MAYVYAICDPRHKGVHGFQYLPIYVGKGTNSNRATSHINDARAMIDGKMIDKRKNKDKLEAIASVIRSGAKPVVVIVHDNMDDHEALLAEDQLIAKIGKQKHGGPLTNKAGSNPIPVRCKPFDIDDIINEKRRAYWEAQWKWYGDGMTAALAHGFS